MTWPPADRPPRKPKKRRAQPEADFQKSAVAYLRLALPDGCGVWWSATLNGIHLKTPKARKRAKEQGLNPGLYDLIFVKLKGPGAGQTFHFEAKSATGTLTVEQAALMAVLGPAGRAAKGSTLDELCDALVAWDMPIRFRV